MINRTFRNDLGSSDRVGNNNGCMREAINNLSISASGRITVNPTAEQTAVIPLDEAIIGELWRTLQTDDYQEVRSRVRIEVRKSVG